MTSCSEMVNYHCVFHHWHHLPFDHRHHLLFDQGHDQVTDWMDFHSMALLQCFNIIIIFIGIILIIINVIIIIIRLRI